MWAFGGWGSRGRISLVYNKFNLTIEKERESNAFSCFMNITYYSINAINGINKQAYKGGRKGHFPNVIVIISPQIHHDPDMSYLSGL